jgi:phenylpyruvate tautomerase PptA (4-oxalocrotonate tautomerase family)
MPIVDVTIVAGQGDRVDAGLTQTLADAIGHALDSPPGQTWVRLHVLAQDCYAENHASPESTDLPVFVAVLQRQVPHPSPLAESVSRLTKAVAEATGRPADRVHVEYAPSASGRVAFGGKLVM